MTWVRSLEWDSRFFGLPVGRIEIPAPSLSPEAIAEALREAGEQNLSCLYLQVPFASPETIAYCSRRGFLLVDLKTVLSKPLGGEPPSAEAADDVVGPEPGHYPALQEIAECMARASRFRFDPHFWEAGARRLYTAWLRNSLSGGFASDFLVAVRDSRPEGFLTLRTRDGVPHIDLLGVAEAARGKGVAGRLIRSAESRLRAGGAGRLDVDTQGHNVAALGLYQKSGFRIVSVDVFFHIWLEELG